MTEHERVPTVVIGAGPAGLAVAACLRAEGLPFVVLEAEQRVASSWRRHYDRLHLHTVKRHSHLPLLEMPAYYPKYPSRQQVVAYLEAYARHFDIRPRFGQRVHRIARAAGLWDIQTSHGTLRADHVVVATGYNRVPNRPAFPGIEAFPGEVLHSSEYGSGAAFDGQQVLVVGCGNSGAEIAIDLFEHGARPSLVIRSPIHVIPREMFGRASQESSIFLSRLPLPVADRISRALLKLTVGDLTRWGIRPPKKGPIRLIQEEGRVSMLDIGTLDLIRRGEVRVVPGIVAFEPSAQAPGLVRFADGRRLPFHAVVLATGYRAALDTFLDGADALTDARGYPRKHGEEAAPGLFFTGFRNPPTGAFREMALEAPRIARAIARAPSVAADEPSPRASLAG